MNRIALRLSLGLLSAVILLMAVLPLLARWQMSHASELRTPPNHELTVEALRRYFATLPAADRKRAADEIARSTHARIEIVQRADLPEDGSVGPQPRGPFGVILVPIPGTDEVIRLGPLPPPRPALSQLAVTLLGVLMLVTATGFLLARPLVRRLTALRETAIRIASGDLGARADPYGNDAISDFAARFNQMADRNQALLEGQRDLLRGVSHELRTPVARIRFSLELARDPGTELDRERHLCAIDADLGEIDELIQELLLVDRLSDGSVSAPARAFGVLFVVRHEMERQRVSRPEVELSVDSALDGRAQVIGSEQLFRRAVRNLLSNAIRHARSHVRVSIARASEGVLLQIDDDGPGIPVSERARVLEPFVRLDESRSRELGGVGLGLTIVDRIVRATGGSLRIGEADSGGASVAISWPCDGEAADVG